MILRMKSDHIPNSINRLIIMMETCCVFFEVGTQFLNIILMSFVLQRVKQHSNCIFLSDSVL
jgi:hypothetical protein